MSKAAAGAARFAFRAQTETVVSAAEMPVEAPEQVCATRGVGSGIVQRDNNPFDSRCSARSGIRTVDAIAPISGPKSSELHGLRRFAKQSASCTNTGMSRLRIRSPD